MEQDHDKREDPDVRSLRERSLYAVGAGVIAAICGGAAVITAGPANVQAVAGGWGAVWSGVLLASVGGLAARGHATLLQRNRQQHEEAMAQAERQHETVMAELEGIRVALPASDLERHRQTR